MLAITRGGLVPAGMLAYRLGIRNILVAAVEYYDDEGHPGPEADLPPVPGRSPPPRPAGPDRRRGLGQRDDDPRRDRTRPPGGRDPDDRRPPLQADPFAGPRRARLPRGDDGPLGRLSVQGGQLTDARVAVVRGFAREHAGTNARLSMRILRIVVCMDDQASIRWRDRHDPLAAPRRHLEGGLHPRRRRRPHRLVDLAARSARAGRSTTSSGIRRRARSTPAAARRGSARRSSGPTISGRPGRTRRRA